MHTDMAESAISLSVCEMLRSSMSVIKRRTPCNYKESVHVTKSKVGTLHTLKHVHAAVADSVATTLLCWHRKDSGLVATCEMARTKAIMGRSLRVALLAVA